MLVKKFDWSLFNLIELNTIPTNYKSGMTSGKVFKEC